MVLVDELAPIMCEADHIMVYYSMKIPNPRISTPGLCRDSWD